MRYEAIGDKIVAKKISHSEKNSAGILTPYSDDKKFKAAIVVDVSNLLTTEVKVGDYIRYHTTIFDYSDDTIILREDHIASIIRFDSEEEKQQFLTQK